MNKFLTGMFLIVLCFSFASAQETKKENMTDYFQTGLQKTEMRITRCFDRQMGRRRLDCAGAAREEFTGTENVQRKVDGLALLVEGRFTDKKDSAKVIHETLAVLNYNPKTDIYDFKTYLASGRS
ncbi:MAG: hypothetical protein ACR2F2_04995 [Pyrinomonadaceae bacterium]